MSDAPHATYRRTNGTRPETMTIEEAEALLAELGDRVADSFTSHTQDSEIYEIYGEGETAADYPNGDPYADTIEIPHA